MAAFGGWKSPRGEARRPPVAYRGRDNGGRDGNTAACQSAAEQRIQRDGYRNVQFGRLGAENNRRNDGIAGTATAQRGNNGRAYDFDIRCSVNLDNGNIRSVEVKRR